MTTEPQLDDIDAILGYVSTLTGADPNAPFLAVFPSGRQSRINPPDQADAIRRRAPAWLRRYRVIGSPSGVISLLPRTFSYDRSRLISSTSSIRRLIQNCDREQQRMEARRTRLANQLLDAEDGSRHWTVNTPSLQTLQETIGSWPSVRGVYLGPWRWEDVRVQSSDLAVGFIPVIFRQSGNIAITATMLAVTGGRGLEWKEGMPETQHHPHVSGRFCFGSAAEAITATARSNQVIATYELIQRWRLGYNPQDAYTTAWARIAWEWYDKVLHSPHPVTILPGWDKDQMQEARNGEVVSFLDVACEFVGGDDREAARARLVHAGLRVSPEYPLTVNLERVQQCCPSSEETRKCTKCNGSVYPCTCHQEFCGGCGRVEGVDEGRIASDHGGRPGHTEPLSACMVPDCVAIREGVMAVADPTT